MAQLNSLLVTGDSRFLNPINGNARNGIYYVKGTQTAATGAWTGNIPVPALYDGLTICYYLPYAGSGNATLNLTLSTGATTGAINCYYQGNSRLTTHYGAGSSIMMTYHPTGSVAVAGTTTTDNRWVAGQNYVDGNNTNDLTNYYNRFKAGANKVFPYTIIMQCSDGRWESIVTSSSTGTSKARNTHGFRLGQIAVMYANATYAENATIGDNTIYEACTRLIDHRYSFNTANDSTNGTTAVKPVYLVGTLNASDGLFYLDTTWWTQTLPTSDNGKLYIYLGDAYDYYRMTFRVHHPIYWYKNGAIRQFIQDAATINGKALPTSTSSATTGISIAAHGTGSVTGVQSTTTTASKVTLGTAISLTGVQSTTTTASKVTLGTAISVPNVTAVGSGSFTQGTFSGGSGSFTATVTNGVLSFSHTHTAATHGADSHTHTPPTLGIAISVPNVTGATDVTVPIKNSSATSIPNVTAATNVTVPIKNTSASTFVTGTTHTVTDNGHTHNLS